MAVDQDTDKATQRLERYIGDLLGERVELLQFERIGGGWSRQTYKVGLRSPSRGEFRMALRGELEASLLDDNLDREYQILSLVNETAVPVPAMYGFESTKSVLGYRFILMEWVDGLIPTPWRKSALAFIKQAAARGKLGPAWVRDIAALHSIDPGRVRAAGLDVDIDAEAHVTNDLKRWLGSLRASRCHPGPLVEEACQWLEAHRPAPADCTTLLHGDLRIGNMVVRDDKVVAFLDWELFGLGDWRAEVMFCLMNCHAGKILEPIQPSMNALMHPAAFLDQYLTLTGKKLSREEILYFLLFNLVKGAGILLTGIEHVLAGSSNDVGRSWSSFPITGYVDDIDYLLSKGLPW